MVEPETDLTEIDWLPRLSVCPLTEQQCFSHSSATDQVLLASSPTSKPPYRLNPFTSFTREAPDCNTNLTVAMER